MKRTISAAIKKDLSALTKAWPAVRSLLSCIRTERQFKRVQAVVDELLDTDGDEELIDALMTLMQVYEHEHRRLES